MKVGIIGGAGWIGSSLGRALIDTGRVEAPDLTILNRAGQPGTFDGHAVGWARDPADLVGRCDVVVVSVRPQDWPVLALDAAGKLVISVMAGVPLRSLPPRAVRALPNAAAELRQSCTPWFAADGLADADRADALRILSAIGTCEEVQAEHHLDLMTATVGAGPAYLALMARSMIAFLVERGVAPSIAERVTDGMICGAAPLLSGRMAEVSQTVQRFIDYDGTTAAGLRAATERGFDDSLAAAFAAATARAQRMA